MFLDSGDFHDASKAKINVLEALNLISSAWDSVDRKCIINGFNKAGFSISEEESAVVLEGEQEGSVSVVEDLPEVDDAYIDCDTDIITSEILFISDLMPDSDDSADDDEITEDVPTAYQAIQSIKTLKQFLLPNVNQEANLQKLVSIERAVYEIVARLYL
nr:uncharacterized protein LOC122270650 [Parasteatoda tepidariorum]